MASLSPDDYARIFHAMNDGPISPEAVHLVSQEALIARLVASGWTQEDAEAHVAALAATEIQEWDVEP